MQSRPAQQMSGIGASSPPVSCTRGRTPEAGSRPHTANGGRIAGHSARAQLGSSLWPFWRPFLLHRTVHPRRTLSVFSRTGHTRRLAAIIRKRMGTACLTEDRGLPSAGRRCGQPSQTGATGRCPPSPCRVPPRTITKPYSPVAPSGGAPCPWPVHPLPERQDRRLLLHARRQRLGHNVEDIRKLRPNARVLAGVASPGDSAADIGEDLAGCMALTWRPLHSGWKGLGRETGTARSAPCLKRRRAATVRSAF